MNHTQWQAYSRDIMRRATAVRCMIMDRANATAHRAGIDNAGLHAHNAMVSHSAGAPWRGVDYSLVRQAQRLVRQSYRPERLAYILSMRAFNRMVDSTGASYRKYSEADIDHYA